jgi:AraC-type DNA-binding domain-containing proteins
MIRHLDGIYETVDYRTDSQICLYDNIECEDYPLHWHTSFELIMPIVNTYDVVCGENRYHLREGDLLIICPSMIHELYAPDSGERIIFQPSTGCVSIKEMNLLVSMLSPAALITPEEYPTVYEQVYRDMLEIKDEYFSYAPYAESRIVTLFLEIMVLVGRNHKTIVGQNMTPSISRQKEYVDKFQYVTSYIEEHFAEDLTLEQAATLAGFSKYHFSRLFRQYTNTPFYRYLNQKRIDHAKTLLANPSLTMIEVALQSGFSSQSAFLRMFKQLNNCTPTEFRNMYKD